MTKTKTARTRHRRKESEAASLFSVSAKSYAVSLCISALLLLAFSYIAYMTADPAAFVDGAAYICLALSSLAGGIVSAVTGKENASAVAAASGGMYVLTLLIFALATDNINSPLYMLLGYGASVALFVLGALLWRRLAATKRRRRRR